MGQGKKLYGMLLGGISAVFYGAYPILARFTVESGINHATVLFLRFLFCSLFLWGYCLLRRRDSLHLSRRTAVGLFALGLLVYSAMSGLNLRALTSIPVSLASLLLCTYPVFVILFSVLLRRERATRLLAFSLAACIFGLWLLMDVKVGRPNPLGLLMGLGAGIINAVYVLGGSMIGEEGNPIVRAALIMTGTCCAYGVLGAFSGDIRFDFAPAGWFWIVCVAVLTTAIPVLAFWSGVALAGAVHVSVVGSLEPVSTVVLSLLVLHEPLRGIQIAGAVIVLCGITAIQLPQRSGGERKEADGGAA